jgi:hypothetical protein
MKRMSPPPFGTLELFDESVSALNDPGLRAKFIANRPQIEVRIADFDAATLTKTWCNLPRSPHGNPDSIVVGTLTKSELVALYEHGVVGSTGKSRDIYDKIKLAAHDECPYCGGIGDTGHDGELGTADHYLPKARFPAYSVLPLNLVPACMVCNKGMGSNFAQVPDLQPVHPYLDAAHFFSEKWIVATIKDLVPLEVDYTVSAPAHWLAVDRNRVAQHFIDCKLETRYRSRVHSELSPLISQRKTTLRTLDANDFRAHLETVANEPALPLNGWKRALYAGLASTLWFCEREF